MVLVNTDAVPLSENTFQISNHSHQFSKKAGLVTVVTKYMQLKPVPIFAPMKKGGGQQNEPEVC